MEGEGIHQNNETTRTKGGAVTTLNEYIQLYVHVSVAIVSPRACGVEGEMRDTINVSVMEKVLSLDSSPVVKGFHRVHYPVRS